MCMSQAMNTPERVNTTESNEETYNSSTIYDFTWREPKKDDEFEEGRLIVRFQNNSRSTASSVYLYDVQKKVFEEMKARAYNPEDYIDSVGEFYNNRLVDYVIGKSRYSDHLYKKKKNLD